METKRFPLRDVLTVTTGKLLTAPTDGGNGIEALYDILHWMTGESPYTHQLGRFADECKPHLLRWFPELESESTWLQVALADVPSERVQASLESYFFAAVSRGCKSDYEVPRIPRDDHRRCDPIAELIELRGSSDGVIAVEAPCPSA